MLILYEVGIMVAKIVYRKRQVRLDELADERG
jgi:Sec-independent protein secretion pathway component TatC